MSKTETVAPALKHGTERSLGALMKSLDAAEDDLDRNGTIPTEELRRAIDEVYAEHARETGQVRSTAARGSRATGSR